MEDKRIRIEDGDIRANWPNLLDKYRFQLSLALAALILIGLGLLFSFSLRQNQLQVEVITPPAEKITIDLAGAVLAPGVYELASSARLNDLLIRAGGLAAMADRDWVNANLNLAQKLTDGQKIFIPEKVNSEQSIANSNSQPATRNPQLINVNTASAGELDTLWGIGPARAQAIITNRPYGSIDELKTKVKIPASIFEKIEDRITVY
jgi:competence protein ComEA